MLKPLSLATIGLMACMSLAHADYSSSLSPAPKANGYHSDATPETKNQDKDHLVIKNKLFSLNINLPHKKKHHEPVNNGTAFEAAPSKTWRWVDVAANQPIPPRAVVGGYERGAPLFICHAEYLNGMHPGKIVGGNCNISYNGSEMPMTRYQVLVSQTPPHWLNSNGNIPPIAIRGGHENGQPLIICQADYAGGVHPGKLIGNNCDIGYGGREISLPNYRLLVF